MVKKILSRLFGLFQSKTTIPQKMPLQDAVKLALSAKLQSDSERTRETFSYQFKLFKFYIVVEKLHEIDVLQFTKTHAVAYMDYLSESRSISNTTWNNYLTQISSLFSELKERQIIEKNPFAEIKLKKEIQTKRRPFTPSEAVLIANHIRIHKPVLFLAIILEHYCLIRPEELRRLRLSAIDFEKSIIRIPADVAKTNVSRNVTIPRDIWEYLTPLAKHPSNYFLFGKCMKPHPSIMCGESSLSNTHRTILKDLQKQGLLNEIDTICFYSWKYLGIKEYAELFGVLASQMQAGHKTAEMTLRYYRPDEVNKDILNLKIPKDNDL